MESRSSDTPPRLVLPFSHPWDLSPAEAIELQQSLRARVRLQPLELETIRTVAGVDAGFPGGQARAAVVVLAFPSLQVVEEAAAEVPIPFPYIPGLLSFREIPAVLAALERLHSLPDVLICDGQGIAHPRRLGIASHLGVLLDRPALGCAKSILVGRHAPVGEAVGSQSALVDGGEVIGAVVRTRANVKPVILSPGHRIDVESGVRLALACSRGCRLPEPTRLADRLASQRDR